MTREQILDKHLPPDEYGFRTWTEYGVLSAMDEYAKEQGTAFSKWLGRNKWAPSSEEGVFVQNYHNSSYDGLSSLDSLWDQFIAPQTQTTNTDTKSERPEST